MSIQHGQLPGSNVSPGLAAAFVMALFLFLLLTDPAFSQALLGR